MNNTSNGDTGRWRRKSVTKGASAAIVALLVTTLVGVSPAYAGTAVSSYGYYTVNGVQYQNLAQVDTNASTHYVVVYTTIGPQNVNIAAGWVGVNPRLFNGNTGALVCDAGTAYNSTSVTVRSYFGASGCSRTATGVWYSYGVTRSWTGSSYQPYYTFPSPNQNS